MPLARSLKSTPLLIVMAAIIILGTWSTVSRSPRFAELLSYEGSKDHNVTRDQEFEESMYSLLETSVTRQSVTDQKITFRTSSANQAPDWLTSLTQEISVKQSPVRSVSVPKITRKTKLTVVTDPKTSQRIPMKQSSTVSVADQKKARRRKVSSVSIAAKKIMADLETYEAPSSEEINQHMTGKHGLDMNPTTFDKNITTSPCWHKTMTEGSKLFCLPKAYLLGFTKCATSDLWLRMSRHPLIKGAQRQGEDKVMKEIHWWSVGRYKGQQMSRQYANYFGDSILRVPESKREKITLVDASPDTVWALGEKVFRRSFGEKPAPKIFTPSIIKKFTPGAKFIVSMRNPVDRLYSHYQYISYVRGNKVSAKEFHVGVNRTVRVFTDCFRRRSTRDCVYDGRYQQDERWKRIYLHVGLYVVFLSDWLKVIPRKQFHFITTDEYSVDNYKVLKETLDFLGVDSQIKKGNTTKDGIGALMFGGRTVNKMSYKSAMLNTTREMLKDFYRPFNEALAILLNDTKYLWTD